MTRLAAIEELASVDVLCSDKTGALTQNELTLGDPFSIECLTGEQASWPARWPRAPTTRTPSTWRCSAG